MCYIKMPYLLDLYMRKVRKTPQTWMTTPLGVMVPPSLWPSYYMAQAYNWIRAHEAKHFQRMTNRPYLSRWWWCVKYIINPKMCYEEEVLGIREELRYYSPGAERYEHAVWCTMALKRDYKIEHSPEKILQDLLFGLETR